MKDRLKRCFIINEDNPVLTRGARTVNIILVLLLLTGLFWFGFSRLNYPFYWDTIWKYRVSFFSGFKLTILISLFSLALSLAIGLVSGLAQSLPFVPFRVLSRVYVEGIRGTPLLVQILIFFYVIANALGVNNRFIVGIVIMSIFSGAYISEIIRSGVESIGESQLETARSLGFTRGQTYRYIIFPQVISRILPPLAGQFASLIKDSSLLSIIAIKEFTMAAREVNANTFSTLESYIPLAVGYLLLTLPVSALTKYLERKYSYAS
ncbi:MAG: amino acid ABC transporter permease [Spirochaetales bacterium]|nr:amino acid ABC transporter permease [Spirochaetales bacterium]